MRAKSIPDNQTAFIPVGSTHVAIVDAADYPRLSQYKWLLRKSKNTNYAIRYDGTPSRSIGMHNDLLPLPKGKCPDHVNGNGLDNRRANLRESTPSQNRANARRRHNVTGYQGVHRLGRASWGATIQANGILYSASRFTCPEDAARWYDKAARELFGDFAVLNFPGD